jgi:hypothetical protein
LLLIEDLGQVDLFGYLQLFADDTILSYSYQDWNILQDEIMEDFLSIATGSLRMN